MHNRLGALDTITENDAARLLVTESALGSLAFSDARRIVSYMKPKRIKVGATLIREGEKTQNDFMMLILAGDVRVESHSPSSIDEVVLTVMGAGHLIGELGMINDSARSATCVATTDLAVAVLSRASVKKMLSQNPALAANLFLAISSRVAERLRETTSKLKKFMQLNAMLQNEVYVLMDSQGRASRPSSLQSSAQLATEPMPLPTQPAALPEGYVRSAASSAPMRRKS
jgi:CRP/FNR family transcriptional regulator, cyclic AMP receptor protein